MTADAGKALIIVQKPTSDPAKVGAELQRRGIVLDVRCPNEGDPLPANLDGIDAVLVFGGPMSANDDGTIPGIRAQLEFLPKAMDAGTPTLGICLGAQLIARTLGAAVAHHPDGRVEIGYHPITPTLEGETLFPDPMTVYQWHREGFDLPHGAIRLATSPSFINQAVDFGANAYGLQFHPEAGRQIVDRWSGRNTDDFKLKGAQPRDEQLAGVDRFGPAIDRWLERFLDRFLALGKG